MNRKCHLPRLYSRRHVLGNISAGLALGSSGILGYAFAAEPNSLNGELFVTLKSPKPDVFNDIVLPAHQGLIREGIQDDVQISRYLVPRNVRADHAHYSNVGARSFMLQLRAYGDHIDFDLLKKSFDVRNGGSYLDGSKYSDMSVLAVNNKVMGLLNESVKYVFADAALVQYMTSEASRKPLPGPDLSRSRSIARIFGGVGATEFERRRIFFDFVDNQLPGLIGWANSDAFAGEFVFVAKTALPKYQFDLGGYVFNVRDFIGGSGSGHVEFDSVLAEKNRMHEAPGGGRSRIGVLVTMSESDAEELAGRLSRKPLYTAYRASVESTMDHGTSTAILKQSMRSSGFEIFSDPSLKDKVLDVPV